MTKTVALMATLDTKGAEVGYLKGKIEAKGHKTLIIDTGIRGEPLEVKADVTRQEIARAGGATIEELIPQPRGAAVEVMVEGLKKLIPALYARGRFDGVLSIGGEEGTIMGTTAMKALPLGVPKLMVSPVASGAYQFGPFVGVKDVTMMHSVTDILGLNELSRRIFDNAAGAIVGMVEAGVSTTWGDKKLIAVSMNGNTTPAIMYGKPLLEAKGYELIIFHANGTGGPAMETLVREGVFKGVLDYTPHEVTDAVWGGRCDPGPTRLDAPGEMGLPFIVVPGCTDFIVHGSPEEIPGPLKARRFYPHNPMCSLVRTSGPEMRKVGEWMAEKLNRAKGPVAVLVPLRGLSMYSHPGEPLHDPKADAELFTALEKGLRKDIRVEEIDAHINDYPFVDRVVAVTLELMQRGE